MSKLRRLVVLNLFSEGPVREQSVAFGGIQFQVTEHHIGWDVETAEALVSKYDGHVDGIALSGVQKRVAVGRLSKMNPFYLRLIRRAARTPIYLADDIRDFFSRWTLQRILKEQPQLFLHKRVLFQCAVITPFWNLITEAGGKLVAADSLLLLGVPILLKGISQVQVFLRALAPVLKSASGRIDPESVLRRPSTQRRLDQWIRSSDVLVTFSNFLDQMDSLACLHDKIVVTDTVSAGFLRRLEESGAKPAQIIRFVPEIPALSLLEFNHFSLLTALIDQTRLAEDSPLSLDDFLLKWVQETEIRPNRLVSSRGAVRRCAFVIHALSDRDLWRGPGLSRMVDAPDFLKNGLKAAFAKAPPFHYGQLRRAVSLETGQEVVCDLYALALTPRQMLAMDEEVVYDKLVACAEMAKKRGALMMGLGAYTKVIGDAGVTVARRSPIPVTNGNSYSASTTLWAARVMVERMGLLSSAWNGQRRAGKVMIIGATGGIGRVSSLLTSLVFDEVVLAATRPDRLLELRDEVLALSPGTRVRVTTNPNHELRDTDLIVTATSNQSGTILDIEKVKPGAVICDCSRPLDIGAAEAAKRPDVLVIESGEVILPGKVEIDGDIGLPKPSVYACLAETVLLAMEGRFENFSLSKQLSMEKVKEIYKIGVRHGASLSAIQGPEGVITDEHLARCRSLALASFKIGLKTDVKKISETLQKEDETCA